MEATEATCLAPCLLQGCGRSEAARGRRFYVESYDDYVADVLQFTRYAWESRLVAADSWPLHLPLTSAALSPYPANRLLEDPQTPPGFGGGLPRFILGSSLGGCIAYSAILKEVRCIDLRRRAADASVHVCAVCQR